MGECRGQTYSDDGGDEFDEEFVKPQERRVEVIEVVNEQTLDMRTIVILLHCQLHTHAKNNDKRT